VGGVWCCVGFVFCCGFFCVVLCFVCWGGGGGGGVDEPNLQGFDYFFGQKDQAKCHNMYPSVVDVGAAIGKPSIVMPVPLNEKTRSRALCMADPSAYNYTIDMFQSYGLRWLDHAATQDKPFFL